MKPATCGIVNLSEKAKVVARWFHKQDCLQNEDPDNNCTCGLESTLMEISAPHKPAEFYEKHDALKQYEKVKENLNA